MAVYTPTQAQIVALRNCFFNKLKESPPTDPFHPADLKRIRKDLWCYRFLQNSELNMSEALERMWETCVWRKKNGVRDLSERNLRKEYLTDGVLFPRNVDLHGNPLLIFRVGLHTEGAKDIDEAMRVVVYWVERLHRKCDLQKITMFFDMTDTGLSGVDLNFIMRNSDIFRIYYPNNLHNIIVYNCHKKVTAALKIGIEVLLGKSLVKVITKEELFMYVDKDNSLKSWGGNDDYVFEFVPETP